MRIGEDSDGHDRLEGRHRLCHESAIGSTECREVRLGDGDWPLRLIVVRNDSGYAVFRNLCPHAGSALNWQPHRFLNRERTALICATHGALFERTSGACIAGPCAGRSLRRYPVDVDADGWLWADLGGG